MLESSQYGVLEGAKYTRLNSLKKDPVINSVLTKLTVDRSGRNSNYSSQKQAPPSDALLQIISDKTTQNIADVDNIFQLLPDTEMAMQILISSILSPKDMVNVEINFTVDSKRLETEISGPLLEIIRDYFETTYRIKDLLPSILEDALFKKGSYPLMVIPESTIDDIINSNAKLGMEQLNPGNIKDNFNSNLGILGRNSKVENFGLESYFNGLSNTSATVGDDLIKLSEFKYVPNFKTGSLKVTDNYNITKLPLLMKRVKNQRLQDVMGVKAASLESRRSSKKSNSSKEITDWELRSKLFTSKNTPNSPFIRIHTKAESENATVGHPLVIKLPPESVIPVHTPSNPEDHIGYFVLLDNYGNPINRATETDYYRNLSTNLTNSGLSSNMLDSAANASRGIRNYSALGDLAISESVRVYGEVVERDLLARLKNGIYGENVELSRPQDVYRIMLSRTLANMDTQIMYVPTELITYFAFKYTSYGVGKSLLEDSKILANIRSMLMFSNTMGAIKNSISKTKLEITLDPSDPSPSETVDQMMHEYAKHRSASYPLGVSSPNDLVDYLQNAGVDIQVSGNSAYPETRLDVSDYNSSKVAIDTELEEDIKRRYFMSLGLSPETIDMTSDVEFATSIVTSNLLLAKRVMLYQNIFGPLIKDHVIKYTVNSSILLAELYAVINKNKSKLPTEIKKLTEEEIVSYFFDALDISLPKPDSAKLETQIAAYDLYVSSLESAIEAYLGSDSFSIDGYDDVEGSLDAVKSALIAHYKREWLRANNVLPELMDITTMDETGKPILDLGLVHGNHMELVGKSIVKLLRKLKKDQLKRQKELEKIEAMANEGDDPEATEEDTLEEDVESDEDSGVEDDAETDTETEDSATVETETEDDSTTEEDTETEDTTKEKDTKEDEDPFAVLDKV